VLLIDGHLDLAMNALELNRDLDLEVTAIRRAEAGMEGAGRGRGTTALPQMRQADLGVCLATVFSRTAWPGSPASGAATQEITYARAQGHLAYYRVLAAQGKVRLLTDWPSLDRHVRAWQAQPAAAPFGFILSMEGADPVVWPEQVESWWADGMRVISLSHYGVSGYAHGTETEGGLLERGRPLLRAMESAGMVLDLSHLADRAFWEALEAFGGPVLASHNNCRALVPGQRQFDDEQIRAIAERGGVIGVALDAWMLYPGWVRGQTSNQVVGLQAVADHLDHVCQVTGSGRHAAIGSDLDGGYGTEQCPHDLDTIADLQRVPALMEERGYTRSDAEAIMHGNWLRFFREAWS
jgi:membrane dipeptidase